MRYFAKTCTMGSEVAFFFKKYSSLKDEVIIDLSRLSNKSTSESSFVKSPTITWGIWDHLVWHFKQHFSVFKQYYMYFHTFFYSRISKNTNNIIRTMLSKHYILSILPKALYSGEVFRVIFHIILFLG